MFKCLEEGFGSGNMLFNLNMSKITNTNNDGSKNNSLLGRKMQMQSNIVKGNYNSDKDNYQSELILDK